MWNQWSGGSSSLPSPSLINSQAPLIGPVQPAGAADVVPTQTNASVMSSSSYSASSSAPSYTPAQYAAMTPEQQYAVQQHWQQWQAYEQQYAQWHAQYGEQYKREMAAIHGVPPSITPQYAVGSAPLPSSFAYPPPSVSNAYQVPQVPDRVPPPPPPDEKTVSAGIKALPHIYNQPPPPPPPPQNEENSSSSHQLKSTQLSQTGSGEALQVNLNQDSRWAKPPPAVQSADNYWGERSAGEGQQDRPQFNRSNQQGSKLLQREQQNRDLFEEDQSYENRDRSTYRGRNRGRSGTSFENNRYDEERTNRQQILQPTDNQLQKNTCRSFGSRMNPDISNKIVGQRFRQQGSSSNSTFGIAPDVQRQQQNEANSEDNRFENSQNNRSSSGSIDEKAFDEQFRLWEEQFENWKKENANHPDRTMYMQYEQEFEKTRIRLLERREQMRRRKMRDLPQSMQLQAKVEGSFGETNLQKQNHTDFELKTKESLRREDFAKREQCETDKSDLVKSSSESKMNSFKLEIIDTKIIKNKEITELFKTASGIPGLDLVDLKEDTKSGKSIDGDVCSEVIDLEKDGPSRPTKFPGNNDGSILPLPVNQPEVKPLLSDVSCRLTSSFTSLQPQQRKIPSLFDIVVEMPELSPNGDFKRSPIGDCSASRSSKNEIVPALASDSRARSISNERDLSASPGQRPISQLSSTSQRPQFNQNSADGLNGPTLHDQSNSLPPQATDLAKALQDPNVMQLLSVALAQAQQVGGIDVCGNRQQSQLIQQLQPLMQMQQQERSSFNQLQLPEPWKNQKQNSNNNKNTSNSRQNRGCFNPFQRNDDEISGHRGPVCSSDVDNTVQTQPKNPHNPFRRNIGLQGIGENVSNKSSGNNFKGSCEFFNNNNGQGGSGSAQPPRDKIGRFDIARTHSTFGISLGFRNNQNNFGDRGGDDCYRPAQVFDYQNRSRVEALVPPAKVVDYGHKPSATMSTNSFARDNSEFVPVKTIDYGHASSSVQIDYQFQQKNKWEQDQQVKFQGYRQFQAENPNQEAFLDTRANKSENFSIKEQISKNKLNQKQNAKDISKSNDGIIDEQKKESIDVGKDATVELEDDETSQYPNNKWILQNADSRRRPGLPTKRGTRNPYRLEINKKSKLPSSNVECAEVIENFEEISDSEDLNEDINNIPPKHAECLVKSRPLFPSVSDSTASTSMVFPSMENNNTIPIDEILFKPGRLTRPKNIVIIIRGPPGSGKSHVAKLIKDKELEMGGATPRLLSIDDYFMIENDYEEKCPKTGRKIPKKEILYEYEKEMEDTYMQYLIKSFKKTVTDHLFDFIIVDCCNQSLRTFNEFYNAARDGNFSPFIIDMICDLEICLSQNIHNRNEEDIRDIIKNYQECPGHYIKLDVSNLLENVVEMEDVSDLEDHFVADTEAVELDDDDDEVTDNDGGGFLKSKWDTDPTTQNLARLDGTSKPISKRGTATLEEYLQIDGWEPPASSANGKKRVRWADIEEKRAQDKMRAIGFVVGQTDWNRMMDPTSGSGALTKTKYIERLNKRR